MRVSENRETFEILKLPLPPVISLLTLTSEPTFKLNALRETHIKFAHSAILGCGALRRVIRRYLSYTAAKA
jgi:hypothetical protein